MLGHKTSLNKFKNIEIISSIFSDHNSMRLEINYKKKIPEVKESKSVITRGMRKLFEVMEILFKTGRHELRAVHAVCRMALHGIHV